MRKVLLFLSVALVLVSCAAARQESSGGNSVNIGYGEQDPDQMTMSVSKVKNNKQRQSYSNIFDMIQGNCPGVQISGGRVIIRGIGTNSDAIDPLFIVDGVQVSDISNIDPITVDSIEVLKDGASGSIYGTQSGNGVILITLKK